MIKNKTLVALGAGASKEVNLPTGDELKGRISQLLNFRTEGGGRLELVSGDPLIREALQHRTRGNIAAAIAPAELNAAAHAISRALPLAPSIDNFLDNHRGNAAIEQCGKLAIVRAIVDAERASPIYVDPRTRDAGMDLQKVSKTWFGSFFQVLTENADAEQLAKRLESMVFIIFNYDRCFEQFLYQALQTYYYKMKSEDAAALVNSLKIYHP